MSSYEEIRAKMEDARTDAILEGARERRAELRALYEEICPLCGETCGRGNCDNKGFHKWFSPVGF